MSRISIQKNMEGRCKINNYFVWRITTPGNREENPGIHNVIQYSHYNKGKGHKEWYCKSIDDKFHMESNFHCTSSNNSSQSYRSSRDKRMNCQNNIWWVQKSEGVCVFLLLWWFGFEGLLLDFDYWMAVVDCYIFVMVWSDLNEWWFLSSW